jgi:hypothetical protein
MTGRDRDRTYADALNAEQKGKTDDPCSFNEVIQLQRVDPPQVKGLRRGELLALRVRTQNNVTSLICIRIDNKKYLGSVAFSNVGKLIQCIKKGRKYNIVVDAVAGTAVQIEINDA